MQLDVIVVCLEGGLSFPAAIRQACLSSTALRHIPLLAQELNIVQREVQLGPIHRRGFLRQFRRSRGTLSEELHAGLASVVIQAERFRASLVNSPRVHAEILREQAVGCKPRRWPRKLQTPSSSSPPFSSFFRESLSLFLGPAFLQTVMEMFARMGR